jgi:alkaline phosphatase D
MLQANPHLKLFNAQRGYVRCDVDRERWRTDYRVLSAVTRRDDATPPRTRASFVLERGRPGLHTG